MTPIDRVHRLIRRKAKTMTEPLTPLTFLVAAIRAELIDAESTSNRMQQLRHIVRAKRLVEEIEKHAHAEEEKSHASP